MSDELIFSALCDVTVTRLVFAPFQLWRIPPNISFGEAVNSRLIYNTLWKSSVFTVIGTSIIQKKKINMFLKIDAVPEENDISEQN